MKRTVEVATPGIHLHLRQKSLVLTRESSELARIPLEDLGTLILGSTQLTVSAALLAGIAQAGGVTVVAGSDFQPEGALLPLRGNTTRGERIRAQIGASKPLEKQLWAALVRAKIANQAAILCDESARSSLLKFRNGVGSGDLENKEAQAARVYWPLVFADEGESLIESPFRRRRDGPWPNDHLNYGYAILRAITARAICGAGLLPEFGIHHHNRYDAFALASDLMEPFRPWVDLSVRSLLPLGPSEVTRESKQALLGIYDDPVVIGSQTVPLQLAVDRTASSLAKSFLGLHQGMSAKKACDLLALPSFPEQAC
ncbi:MAG: type II CRISPR-associated endonuclease Cas1 [Planctomycetes bacterium]|nr:type II CRISPR-associated endonuclease Cas1 [Planctomycetota bacterium]MCB9912899.1 type II CRISPR-associated endonuclease Cas1 [Planctomycetota bacterium]HPF13648.1 type II CRISPR-associated endonuclease Cas1 [Planctomycetota bacterium]HRV80168.1 type II CRISPR-associated endonuclease Cas1 [Planctomycetota bacterium]